MNKENQEANHSENVNKPFKDKDSIRVSVLSEALPYIQRFANKRIVIKSVSYTHLTLPTIYSV